MMTIGIVFLLIAVLGFSWTLFGSLIISIFYSLATKNFRINKTPLVQELKFEILLAAYNEEKTIKASLISFEKINTKLLAENSKLKLNVSIGLDHCTDKTLEIVRDFSNTSKLEVKYFENSGSRGKWFIIKQLILKSNATWVSLTDCGSIWHEDLMNEVKIYLNDQDLICIAPSYLPINAGILESFYWRMEQFFRTFENFAGGSLMVHGPTVFYRREALLRAISILGEKHWINDDVAIPLVLRLDSSKNKIHYLAAKNPKAWVRDIGVVSNIGIEKNRRRRIFVGNLQIIKELIAPNFTIDKIMSWLSLRLVFKSLWAYWASFLFVGSVTVFLSSSLVLNFIKNNIELSALVGIVSFVIVFAVIKKSNYIQRLFMAYLSGLMLWKGFAALKDPKSISWS